MPSNIESSQLDLDEILGGDFISNWETVRASPTTIHIRNLIRSGCAYIEFLINSLADIIKDGDVFEIFEISEFDLEFLRDRSLYIDDKGNKRTRPVRLPVVGRIVRKTEILGDVFGKDGLVAPTTEMISRLFDRRDRLMHPRSVDDVMVSADDFLDCVRVVREFMSIRLHFMERYNEKVQHATDILNRLSQSSPQN